MFLLFQVKRKPGGPTNMMLLTCYVDDIAPESLARNVVDRILLKQFDMEELAQAVNEVIEI